MLTIEARNWCEKDVLTFLLVPVSDEEVGQVEAEGEDNRQEAPSRCTQHVNVSWKSQSNISETTANSRKKQAKKNYGDKKLNTENKKRYS
jgi:hypothetical protein